MAGGHFKKTDDQQPEESDFDPLFDSSASDAWLPGATQAQAAQYAKQQAEAIERARQQAEAAQRAWLEAEAAERARLQAEAEERARRQAAAAELARKQAEAAEKARLKAEAAERARKEAEEQARREAEERARRQAEAEAARKEAEAARLQAEAEAERARQEAEAARQQAEAEEKARREAEERRKAEEEERARKEAEERARKEAEAAEQARLIAEAEERARKAEEAVERARQQAEQEAQERARREAEAAEAIRQEAEAARQQALEAEAARKQAEEAAEAARKQAEEAIQQAKAADEARQAAEAEAARQAAEAEERSKHEAAERAAERERAQGETEAARQAAEEARQAAEAEQQARQQAEAEAERARQQAEEANAARQAAEAEAARQQAEAEERARQEAKAKAEAERQEAEAAEQARIAAEAEAERQRREEEERQRREAKEAREAEELARKQAEEAAELARKQAEEEEARKQAEAEAARQAEKAERARQEAERKQAEADELARLEAQAENARLAAENARQKAQAEAERSRLEEEARKARAEAEAARAEAEAARQQAEEEATRARQGAEAAKQASAQQSSYKAEQDALFSPAGVPNISRGATAAPNMGATTVAAPVMNVAEPEQGRQRRRKAPRSGGNGGSDKSRIIKIVAGVIGALVLVVALSGLMVYRDAQALVSQKSGLMSQATTLTKGIMSGDSEAVKTSSQSIASQVSSMRSTTSSPFWAIASAIPVAGDDIRAARGLVEQADNLCQNAMLPAVSALDGVSLASLGRDETVNLDKLQNVLAALSQVAPVVNQSATAINDLPTPHMGQLKDAIDSVKEPLNSLSDLMTQLNSYGSLLPQMLGSDGTTRTYLLAAQNNAELRPTGGLPGSIGTLTITDGHIELGEFISTGSINGLEGASAYGVTEEETALFGDRVGQITNDTNFIPDFSRVGTLFSEIWESKTGTHIDGVIAVDPVFVQSLLKLTGGIEVKGYTIDGDNAAKVILNDAYNTMPTDETDGFFADVASAAFDKVTGNLKNVNLTDLITTVEDGIKNQHFMVWMDNDAEEDAAKEVGAAGELKTDSSNPVLGVFAADDTWSKKSWFFSANTEVSEGTQNSDGTVTYHVTSTFTNNLTAELAAQNVSYVTGYNPLRRDETDMVMWVYLFAPAGGSISNVSSSGADLSLMDFREMSYNGFQVMEAEPRIAGGETLTVTYDVTCAANSAPLTVRQQPTAQKVAGWE